jgi:cobalt/nickel transport system permease protein
MAHIPDGVLTAPVLIGGAVISGSLLALSLSRLNYERIPQAAVLSAALFVSSLITIPVGPSSVHLLLNGLMGLVLGWAAVPAILVALILQAAFFGYGGLLVLGVNTLNIALPALMVAALLRASLASGGVRRPFLTGALAGGLGVVLSGLMVSLSLTLSQEAFLPAAKVILLSYLPLAIVESAVTGAVIAFVCRVSPELLLGRYQTGGELEGQHG